MVFLPRPLLEPSLELLRDDTAAQGLLGYCAARQERGFDLTSFQQRGDSPVTGPTDQRWPRAAITASSIENAL
jgi:hypothetical protein